MLSDSDQTFIELIAGNLERERRAPSAHERGQLRAIALRAEGTDAVRIGELLRDPGGELVPGWWMTPEQNAKRRFAAGAKRAAPPTPPPTPTITASMFGDDFGGDAA